MRRFRFTAFGHFIDLVCFPCQNYLRSRHCCSNCCLRIVVALKAVHCRCTACLDLYFRYRDRLMFAVSLLCLRPLNMVMLTSCCLPHCPRSLLFWVCVCVCFWFYLFLVFKCNRVHHIRFANLQCSVIILMFCLENIHYFITYFFFRCNKKGRKKTETGNNSNQSLTFEWNWRTWIMLIRIVGMLEHWLQNPSPSIYKPIVNLIEDDEIQHIWIRFECFELQYFEFWI